MVDCPRAMAAGDAKKRRFVGRDRELAVLEEARARAERRQPRVVLISGEPGIGKTRLAEEFSESVARSGALIVWGRAWDGGGAPSYWPMVQVLRGLGAALDDETLIHAIGDRASSIAALAPELCRRIGLRPAPQQHDRFQLFDAVSEFLGAAAKERPIVAVFDDLHAADASTLSLLTFVSRTLRDARLLMLGTFRSTEAGMDEATKRALLELAREADTLMLSGLDATAISEWVQSEWAPDLARVTAGNPLFIEGILRARGGAEPLQPAKLPLAPEVRLAIASRVGATAAPTRSLLEAIAVIGRPASLSLIGRVLEAPFDALLEPAERAVEAGLLVETGELSQFRFHHPLVQEVTYAAIAPALRAGLHARAAEALSLLYGAESAAHLEELARHHLAAVAVGSAPRAVSSCHAAGKRAMEVAAFAEAARHFERAQSALAYLPAGATPPVTPETILSDLGEAQLAAGDTAAARSTFDALAGRARASGDADALGRAALGVARTFEFAVMEPRRSALLEEAVAALEPNDSALLARVLARLAQELWIVPGREKSRGEIADRAIAMGERLHDPDTTAFALNAWLQCVWGPAHREQRKARADALLSIADRSGSMERLLEAHRWRINAAVEAGEIAGAERAIADYTRVAEALKRPHYLANAVMRQAMLPQLRGDFDEAVRLAARTRDLQRLAGDPQADVVFDSRRILLLEARGSHDAIAEILPAMHAHVAARPHFVLYRAILLRGLLAAGDRPGARAEWEHIWRDELASVSRDMMFPATLALLVPACIAFDDRRRAERLHAELAPLASLHVAIGASFSLGSMARWVGLLSELLGAREDAVKNLELALAANEAMGARWQAGETRSDLERLGASLQSSALPPDRARLCREGAVWLVEHRGQSARIKNSVGVSYLRRLLEQPGVEIHALDLAGAATGARTEAPASDLGPRIDDKARAAYKKRIRDLEETIAEAEARADPIRAERARAEHEQLTDELARAFGLGGRARPTASHAERARTSVTKALSRAIAAIKFELPELGEHLARAIRSGVFCSYDPDPRARIDWVF